MTTIVDFLMIVLIAVTVGLWAACPATTVALGKLCFAATVLLWLAAVTGRPGRIAGDANCAGVRRARDRKRRPRSLTASVAPTAAPPREPKNTAG